MPQNIQLKRERDRRYREKKRNDAEYKSRRAAASRKFYNKKMENETPRDGRLRKRKERQKKSQYRKRKAIETQENQHRMSNTLPPRASTSKSEAAKNREAKRMKQSLIDLRRTNLFLRRATWKFSKRLDRKKRKKLATEMTEEVGKLSADEIASKELKSPKRAFKTLVAHYRLAETLKSNPKTRKALFFAARSVVQKYKGMRTIFKKSSIDFKTLKNVNRKPYPKKVPPNLIADFFCRDDNSRLAAGKKDTITRNGRKVQKRFLNFSVDFLYEKFSSENDDLVGRSTFYANRPFFVVKPRINDREQCLCIQCSNTQLLADALFCNNILSNRDLPALTSRIVCSSNSIKCVEGNCECCKHQRVTGTNRNLANLITYYQWERIQDEETHFTSTKCVQKVESAVCVIQLFEKKIRDYAAHLFRVVNQFRSIQQVKSKEADDEMILHIDFSENYTSKQEREVQAAHFGNHHQITIHQGVCYTKQNSPQCFVTLSDDHRKTAEAIAAHVNAYLLGINFPIRKLILISDSPSSQYRNRSMLFLMTKVCISHGIEEYEWIFTETGHGKGAPDGVGAVVKRMADNFVAHQGHPVQTAKDIIPLLSETKIHAKLVTTREIELFKRHLNVRLRPMPGIAKCHQVLYKEGMIWYRPLACKNCDEQQCQCHGLTKWRFI